MMVYWVFSKVSNFGKVVLIPDFLFTTLPVVLNPGSGWFGLVLCSQGVSLGLAATKK